MSTCRESLGCSVYLFLVYFISLPLNRFLLLAKLIKNKTSQKIPKKKHRLMIYSTLQVSKRTKITLPLERGGN